MVTESDILLDNWGPGALRRLGLGYDRLSELNPRLIYASLTGYGDPEGPAPGPYSYWPANNPAFRAWALDDGHRQPGQRAADGRRQHRRFRPRGLDGPGGHVRAGKPPPHRARPVPRHGHVHCMVAHMTSTMPFYQATDRLPVASGATCSAPSSPSAASDGYVVLAGAGGAEKWKDLWRLIGREDLIEDPRYLGEGISGEFYMSNFVPAIEEWTDGAAQRPR